MNNLKVGTRIAAGFAAVVVIAITLGLFAYSRIGVIHENATNVTDNSLPSVHLMGQLNANIHATYALLLRHAIATNREEMEGIDQEIQNLRAHNSELIDHYNKDLISNDQDRELMRNCADARAAFRAAADQMLAVSRLEPQTRTSGLSRW